MSLNLNKETTIIGPLNLIEKITHTADDDDQSSSVPCLICEKVYRFPNDKDLYLAHLFMEHRLVIADVEDIALLDEYLLHWSKTLNDTNLGTFCTTMLLDKRPDGTVSKDEVYFMLSDVIVEDHDIRLRLHSKRLENVLTTHQRERTDTTFRRGCIYCRDVITSTCYDFIEHLYTKHFLQLGKPTNLVYVNELIDLVEHKMETLICLFCEKLFKDRITLKEHMRKKGHKRINPDNKAYDKYFLINYKTFKSSKSSKTNHVIAPPTNQKTSYGWTQKATRAFGGRRSRLDTVKEKETTPTSNDDSDSDWSDWEGEEQPVICLFCSKTDTNFEVIKSHMAADHEFDFDRRVEHLNFYQKIKIVNYLRRQIHVLRCPSCGEQFSVSHELQTHLADAKHCQFGGDDDDDGNKGSAIKKWDQPEYFFPTYEDDAFLCYLDDTVADDDDESRDGTVSESSSGAMVIGEERTVSVNKDAEELSREIMNE